MIFSFVSDTCHRRMIREILRQDTSRRFAKRFIVFCKSYDTSSYLFSVNSRMPKSFRCQRVHAELSLAILPRISLDHVVHFPGAKSSNAAIISPLAKSLRLFPREISSSRGNRKAREGSQLPSFLSGAVNAHQTAYSARTSAVNPGAAR